MIETKNLEEILKIFLKRRIIITFKKRKKHKFKVNIKVTKQKSKKQTVLGKNLGNLMQIFFQTLTKLTKRLPKLTTLEDKQGKDSVHLSIQAFTDSEE